MSEYRSEIRGGIEFYTSTDGADTGESCARCGSSAGWRDCGHCEHGFVERDIGDGVVEEIIDVACDYCEGTGGSWHCISSPDWCTANPLPLPGRAQIESTALRGEAWFD